MDHETILHLTSCIYDAVDDPSRWQRFLDDFVKAVRGKRAALTVCPSEIRDLDVLCRSGWTLSDAEIFVQRYAAVDPWVPTALTRPEGTVEADYEFCPREEFEASEAFREFYAPRDCIHGFGGVILVTPFGRSSIAVVRGREEGPFGEPEKAILRAIMPHLRRAALIHGQVGTLKRELAILTDHLNRYTHALFLVDAQHKILFANHAAREIAAARDGIAEIDGRLTIASARDRDEIHRVIDELLRHSGPPLRRVTVSRTSQRPAYRLILLPVRDTGTHSISVPLPVLSILAVEPGLQPDPDVVLLAELFELTPAEARIAGKLAAGLSIDEIGQEMRLSIGTVRTHVKRILSKTSTRRQGEFISLALQSVPVRRP